MRALARPPLLVGLLLAAAPLELAAQHGGMLPGSSPADSAQREFAAAVRAATARYRDPQVASADGYRPIGPDFPGMGEHWLNAALLVAGGIDQSHPQLLEYASIDGQLTLIGVAYAALTQSDTVPGSLCVAHAAWHFHSGTVDEESFIRGHTDVAPGSGDGPRIAVLHAWVWLDNPAGLFATDNWALPFAALGLPVPSATPPAAGMALALAVRGDAYYEAAVRAVATPDSADLSWARTVLARRRAQVLEWVSRARRDTTGGRDTADLVTLWHNVWADIEAGVSPATAERLRAWGAF
jgi:hypothetical protein